MRKVYIALLVAVAALFSVPSSAQVKFGVKGGLNVSKMSVSSDVLDADNRTGWFIGPTMKFTVPIVGLSFDLSALYDQKSTKVNDDNEGSKTIKQQAIDVPINVRYGVGLGDAANIYLFAGPQFAFNVGDKNFKWNSLGSYENTFQLKKSTISINVGAGVTLLSHLQVSANYNIACGRTGDATVWNTLESVSPINKKGRTNTWQVGLAYYF